MGKIDTAKQVVAARRFILSLLHPLYEYGIILYVVKRTRAAHPAFTTNEGGDAMSVSDAVSLLGCMMSLISLLISVYLLGRDK